jgi:ferritin
VEEEKLMTDILGRLEIAGEDKSALFILDQQTAQRRVGAKPGGGGAEAP